MRGHRLGVALRAKALPFAVGVAAMAAGLLLGYIVFGAGLAESFEPDPGVPPPEYLYLDNARVLAFLAQIEGGLSDSERRTRSVTRSVDARFSGAAGEAGGSSEEQQFVEEVVTPTATTRFYRLLDRLKDKGYLAELDAADPSLAKDLLKVEEGAFVRITACRLELPTYMRLYRLYQKVGSVFAYSMRVDELTPTEKNLFAQISRERQADFLLQKLMQWKSLTQTSQKQLSPRRKAGKGNDARGLGGSVTGSSRHGPRRYVDMIGRNPRVPLSSCAPRLPSKLPAVDFLFPIQYAALSDEQSLFSGTLSIVGKVIRIARRGDVDQYQDPEALRTFLAATYEGEPSLVQQATNTEDRASHELATELVEDATVFAPGAVIIPIAIYK
jgi:hypothetical protein